MFNCTNIQLSTVVQIIECITVVASIQCILNLEVLG